MTSVSGARAGSYYVGLLFCELELNGMQGYKDLLRKLIRRCGYDLVKNDIKHDRFPVEATDLDRQIGLLVAPYTMTSPERVWAVINSVKYIVANNIHGDFVECGVWRGGSAMAIAYKLKELGALDRQLWLYDTFSGMTAPSPMDVEAHSGKSAEALLEESTRADGNNIWCIATKEDVSNNILATGYASNKIRLVEGDILETLNREIPEKISMLRLDTDWYESTKKELQVLYPRLVSGGICIIDDYGHWRGSRTAVDEYFSENRINVLLHPIDATGRIFVKP